MKYRICVAFLGSAMLLASCGQLGSEIGCTSEDSQNAVTGMIKKAVADRVRDILEQQQRISSYDQARLSSILDRATFSFTDGRTTRDDPDSSRRFCEAEVKLAFPLSVFETIDRARKQGDLEDWARTANRLGIEHSASAYWASMEYSVQPTDDGTKIVAESADDTPLMILTADLLATFMVSNEIIAQAAEEIRAQAEAEAAEKRAADEEEAAFNNLAAADLEAARAENALAAQRMRAAWEAIAPSRRRELAPLQTAWNRQTEARCTVQAAGYSTNQQEKAAEKIRCETQALNQRAGALGSEAAYNDAEAEDTAIYKD